MTPNNRCCLQIFSVSRRPRFSIIFNTNYFKLCVTIKCIKLLNNPRLYKFARLISMQIPSLLVSSLSAAPLIPAHVGECGSTKISTLFAYGQGRRSHPVSWQRSREMIETRSTVSYDEMLSSRLLLTYQIYRASENIHPGRFARLHRSRCTAKT